MRAMTLLGALIPYILFLSIVVGIPFFIIIKMLISFNSY